MAASFLFNIKNFQMNLTKAKRTNTKIKLSLQSPSGAGKTYSSLLLASGLTDNFNEIAVIDTENASNLYADLGDYNVLQLEQHTPEDYIKALKVVEDAGMKVCIIDTISNEWRKVMSIHGSMQTKNTFTRWNQLTPRHDAFVKAIIDSPMHIIANVRKKQSYILELENGKQVPKKIGLQPIQRSELSYEFTTVFDLDSEHKASVSKDRTGLFGIEKFVITKKTGELIRNWCNKGKTINQVKKLIEVAATIEEAKRIYEAYPTHQKALRSLVVAKGKQINNIKINSNGVSS